MNFYIVEHLLNSVNFRNSGGDMKPKYAAAVPAALFLFFSIIFTACTTTPNELPGETPVERPGEDGIVERPQDETYSNIEKLINEGDSGTAAEEFAKLKDDKAETVIAYAGLLMAAGDYRKAEAELSALISREPMNADAYYTLALVEGLNGDGERQIELLEKALAVDSQHSEALSIRGSIYLSDSKLKKASEMFKASLESNPDNIIALTGYGSVLIREEKYEEAETYLDRAVELDPRDPFTYLDRSSVRSANGNMSGAEEDMSSAIELEPDYFWHYLDRGRLRIRDLGDTEGALEDFNRAIEINPEIFYPYVFRAGIYDEMDELELSAADYKHIIDTKPDYYFAYPALGIVYFLLEEWDGSMAAFEKAFKFEPEEYSYLAMASVAALKKGERSEYMKYFDKSMDKIPTVNIYHHLIRSFRDTSYDVYALRLIQEEEDKNLQKRLLFYIAELYHERGMETAAYSYFTSVRDVKHLGYFESRIAEYELENHYE